MIAIVGTVKVFNDEYLDFENLSIVNVDALTQSESNNSVLIGGCKKEANDCLHACPTCGKLYYAISGNKGPSSKVSGTCSCGAPQN